MEGIALRTYLTVLLVSAAVMFPMSAADTKDGTEVAAPNAPAAVAVTPDSQAADPVVCKVLEPPLGSRLGNRRVCMTEKQWALQSQNVRDTLQKTRTGFGPTN